MAGRVDMGSSLDVGDEGIWVTYARGMNTRAFKEFSELCDEVRWFLWTYLMSLIWRKSPANRCSIQYGESMYGIPKPSDGHENAKDEDDELDIEASIEKELAAMKAPRAKYTQRGVFRPINAGIECVFFMKTIKPVEPYALVKRMCEDAQKCPDPRERKCKYINRLTPVFNTDKATDNGIERVARQVLGPYFELIPEGEDSAIEVPSKEISTPKTTNSAGEPFTVRIERHSD